jgi:hypothetical protein
MQAIDIGKLFPGTRPVQAQHERSSTYRKIIFQRKHGF